MRLEPDNPEKHLTPAPAIPRLPVIAGGLIILLATFAAYGPALSGGILWDDDRYVTENPLLFAGDGLWRIWTSPRESPQYYPLVFSSFWLEAHLWGLSTFGLHIVNVALHAINAILLGFVLRRLRVPGAWLAGAVFALHPVQVESVAWITERKNVLSGLFYLMSLLAYLRFVDRGRWGAYALSLVLFVCAILSKTVTCSLPVAILLCQWWRSNRLGRREVLGILPFFIIGVPLGLMTVWLEKHHVGAIGEDWQLSVLERGLVAGRALWFYAGKLVWPAKLVFNYPRWHIDAWAWWQYLYPAGFLVVVALLWGVRRRIGKGPLFAVAFFAITLTPALGFFDVYPFRYSFVADHFQYHASMGLIVLAAAAVTRALRRLPGVRGVAVMSPARLVFLLPLLCGALTHRQASLYADAETLWRRTIADNPSSWLARYNLALLLVRGQEQDDERVAQAQAHLRTVLDLNPRSAAAHRSLAIIAGKRGDPNGAMDHFRAALDIRPDDPEALYNMAKELIRVGDVAGAIRAYEACLASDPECAPAHNNLGRIFLERGDRQRAAMHFDLALQAGPWYAPALHNQGMVHESKGHYGEAIAYYYRALAADRTLVDSWFRMGVCLRAGGDLAGAALAYREAIKLRPTHADALADLAAMAHDAGRLEEAAQGYRRVLELNPHDQAVRHNLSLAYQQLERYADAAAVLEQGVRLQPDDPDAIHNLAQLLAGCPQRNVRDGPRAVALALKVVQTRGSPQALRTLAAAYAEVRDYDRAAESAEKALELARSLGLADLEEQLARQLREYHVLLRSSPGVP